MFPLPAIVADFFRRQAVTGAGVVAVSGGPDSVCLALVLRQMHAGLTVAPGDPTALANAIERLAGLSSAELAEMGQRGRRFVTERFEKSRIIDRLEAVLTEHAQA